MITIIKDWPAAWKAESAAAIATAQATELSQLEAVDRLICHALETGASFETFRKELEQLQAADRLVREASLPLAGRRGN